LTLVGGREKGTGNFCSRVCVTPVIRIVKADRVSCRNQTERKGKKSGSVKVLNIGANIVMFHDDVTLETHTSDNKA
jgi:hypothetical protein